MLETSMLSVDGNIQIKTMFLQRPSLKNFLSHHKKEKDVTVHYVSQIGLQGHNLQHLRDVPFVTKGKGEKRKEKKKLIPVRTTQFQVSVLQICSKRGEHDRWARDVRGRVEYMQDLIARDAVYHNVCLSNFRSGLQIPQVFAMEGPPRKRLCFGRPEDQQRLEAFRHVTDFLHNTDNDQVTISDLAHLMASKVDGGQSYTNQWLKKKNCLNIMVAMWSSPKRKEPQMW